jgi:hypothetical protein
MAEEETVAEAVGRSMADRVAELVLKQLAPGHAPMIIPADVAEVIARFGRYGMRTYRQPIAGHGSDFLFMDFVCRPDGMLDLNLGLNHQERVWAGTLRGPGVGS